MEPTKNIYGELWLNTATKELKAFNGLKWVSKNETQDRYLLNLLKQSDPFCRYFTVKV